MKRVTQTKNGVVYDIENSPYVSERLGLLFRFSSMKHKEKFDSLVNVRENWLSDSLSRRFKITVKLPHLAAIQLYIQIETRGFSIKNLITKEEYQCPDDIQLVGEGLIGKEYSNL